MATASIDLSPTLEFRNLIMASEDDEPADNNFVGEEEELLASMSIEKL